MGLEEKLPSGILLTTRREARQLDAQVLALAGHLRAGLLRHRDDGRRRAALRPRPLRHGGLPRLAAPGRPDDRRRPGQPEDGARCCARSTTRCPSPSGCIAMGVCASLRRHVQQLRDRPGRRPRRAGRHVPARLPAAAGDAASTRSSSCTTRSMHEPLGPKRAQRRARGARLAARDLDAVVRTLDDEGAEPADDRARPDENLPSATSDRAERGAEPAAPSTAAGEAARRSRPGRAGHVRRRRLRRHLRLRRPRPRAVRRRRRRAAVRRLVRRGRRRARARRVPGVRRRRDRAGRRRPRRADPARRAASTCSAVSHGAARRPGAALRAVLSVSGVRLPGTDGRRSCTRSTT